MWLIANSSGWPWRQKKKEEQDWRMLQLPNGSVGHGDGRRKKIKTGEDVATAQLMLALTKGVVNCGCGFVPQTHSEKLATMLIIQT